jgi:hypothetical protein
LCTPNCRTALTSVRGTIDSSCNLDTDVVEYDGVVWPGPSGYPYMIIFSLFLPKKNSWLTIFVLLYSYLCGGPFLVHIRSFVQKRLVGPTYFSFVCYRFWPVIDAACTTLAPRASFATRSLARGWGPAQRRRLKTVRTACSESCKPS